MLIQSPQVEVLGITVVSGDQWREEEIAHTLRLLEIIGRSDIPVVPGAEFPLVRTREEAQFWHNVSVRLRFAGAWDESWWHEASVVPPLPEGSRRPNHRRRCGSLSASEGAPVPHEVTIYEGGPMTNLALAFPRSAVRRTGATTGFHGRSIAPKRTPRVCEQSSP